MADKDEQGTGRHPHKSTEQPWPHHKSDGQNESSDQQARSGGSSGERTSAGSGDLKQREYRDAQGNVHQHTQTYEEEHERSGRSESRDGESGGSEQKVDSKGSENLDERKYRDKQGKKHHHTRTYEEQHRKAS